MFRERLFLTLSICNFTGLLFAGGTDLGSGGSTTRATFNMASVVLESLLGSTPSIPEVVTVGNAQVKMSAAEQESYRNDRPKILKELQDAMRSVDDEDPANDMISWRQTNTVGDCGETQYQPGAKIWFSYQQCANYTHRDALQTLYVEFCHHYNKADAACDRIASAVAFVSSTGALAKEFGIESQLRIEAKRGNNDNVKAILASISSAAEKTRIVNSTNTFGQTALMFAARGPHSEVMLTLFDSGAVVAPKDDTGSDALDYYIKNSSENALALDRKVSLTFIHKSDLSRRSPVATMIAGYCVGARQYSLPGELFLLGEFKDERGFLLSYLDALSRVMEPAMFSELVSQYTKRLQNGERLPTQEFLKFAIAHKDYQLAKSIVLSHENSRDDETLSLGLEEALKQNDVDMLDKLKTSAKSAAFLSSSERGLAFINHCFELKRPEFVQAVMGYNLKLPVEELIAVLAGGKKVANENLRSAAIAGVEAEKELKPQDVLEILPLVADKTEFFTALIEKYKESLTEKNSYEQLVSRLSKLPDSEPLKQLYTQAIDKLYDRNHDLFICGLSHALRQNKFETADWFLKEYNLNINDERISLSTTCVNQSGERWINNGDIYPFTPSTVIGLEPFEKTTPSLVDYLGSKKYNFNNAGNMREGISVTGVFTTMIALYYSKKSVQACKTDQWTKIQKARQTRATQVLDALIAKLKGYGANTSPIGGASSSFVTYEDFVNYGGANIQYVCSRLQTGELNP